MNNKIKFVTVAAALLLSACSSTKTGSSSHGTSPLVHEFETQVGDRVFFAFDNNSLSSESKQVLERQASFLHKHQHLTADVEGHCDERGTSAYNMGLGERRANSAAKFLESKGIKADRLHVVSYGKERPAVIGDNEASWAKNRRAVTNLNN